MSNQDKKMTSYKSTIGLTILFGASCLLIDTVRLIQVQAQSCRTMEPVYPHRYTHLTLKSGAQVGDKLNSLTLDTHGPILLQDVAYVEEIAHFNRERIPERVVHAKGASAFGDFVVTNTAITKYCKAPLFATEGKVTPVAVRFSQAVSGESGSADTPRDVRGFAVKFYTELGIWDMVGNNLPVFFIRDPINFPSFIHSQKRCPRSHLKDPNTFWEYFALRPETVHTMLMAFTDRGTPDGYRHMHGFGVNTFKLVNAAGEQFYAKFHWITDQGIKNLLDESATKVAGIDPDYHLRDLHLAIAKQDYPSWTLKFQVMRVKDAAKANFNVLDVTKTWPHKDYPLIEVGKMTLNKNPTNYHAQVEQLAFSPANMVSGIEPSPDRLLQGRIFAYPDAQRYRLGANYFDLPVNRPRCPVMTPTYVDGLTFKKDFGNGTVPNYVPSSKFENLRLLDERFVESEQTFKGEIGRYDLSKDDNFSQAKILYQKVLKDDERARTAKNIATNLKLVSDKTLVDKVMDNWRGVDEKLAADITAAMKA